MNNIIKLLLVLAIALPFSQAAKLVLAGGGVASTNAEIYNAFIDLASPNGKTPYIGVITAGVSLEIAESTARSIISIFKNRYGVQNIEWLPFHVDNGTTCTSTALNAKIRSMTGIYFNGGNTGPMLDCFYPGGVPTSPLTTIKSRVASDDLAIFGSSAGTLVLQDNPFLMIQDSWSALSKNIAFYRNGGFGIFNQGFLDVHFNTRAKQGAFSRLIYDQRTHGSVGYGIDEDTAMLITTDANFRVIGTGSVYVFDVDYAKAGSTKASNNGRWALQDIKVIKLTRGDRYTYKGKAILFGSGKPRNYGNAVYAKYSADIFSSNMFSTLTVGFFNANLSTTAYGYTSETNPRYRLDFKKKSTSRMYKGTVNGALLTSYMSMYMDIYCFQNC